MADFLVPIELKINFLECIVIPSFGPRDGLKTRKEWMRERAGNAYGESLEILMLIYNTVETVERAEAKLKKVRDERAAEREFFLQQLAGTVDSNLLLLLSLELMSCSSLLILTSFICYFYLQLKTNFHHRQVSCFV
jgi:hypothetical protein